MNRLPVSVGSYTGLRISDLLKLRWVDVINKESIELIEGKTKKHRKIQLNPALVEIITRLHVKMDIKDDQELLFINRFKSKAINIQYVNRKLKEISKKYLSGNKISYSSHSFRKTLGRRIWTINDFSEKSLLLLSELFGHSSIKITKIFLGIRREEIGDVYLNL